MTYDTLGARIRQSRALAGLSTQHVATRISVKPSTLDKWERGEGEPRANKLLTLAGILGVSVLWLLDGEAPAEADYDARLTQTGATARKLERAIAIQAELAALLSDISDDVSRLQQAFDNQRDAAA